MILKPNFLLKTIGQPILYKPYAAMVEPDPYPKNTKKSGKSENLEIIFRKTSFNFFPEIFIHGTSDGSESSTSESEKLSQKSYFGLSRSKMGWVRTNLYPEH